MTPRAYGSLPLLVRLGPPRTIALAIALTAQVALWQTRRLLVGAYQRRAIGNNIVFWASTHVALVVVATTLGAIVALPSGASGRSELLIVPLVYLAFVVQQIWKNRPLPAGA